MALAGDLTGSILDRRYRITGMLGKGGMGNVYEAVHVALEQRVAVKVLLPRYADEKRFRDRFLQEARAASKIRHRNVVEIKDFGETPEGSVYFVMEYLEGHDLGRELRERGRLPWARVRSILMQATSALHAAHAKRIIHRDIKPANCFLLVDDEGAPDVIKLLDFGIAKVGSSSYAEARSQGLTGSGEVFGTAKYMSPEQARAEVLDARSDIYSLGIMAYEMLVGHAPFKGANPIQIIERHFIERPKPLRDHDARISADVEAVVLKMIAKAPGDRYTSMMELEHALREIPETARRTMPWTSPRGSHAEEQTGRESNESPGSFKETERTAADILIALAETRSIEHVLPSKERAEGLVANASAVPSASPTSGSVQDEILPETAVSAAVAVPGGLVTLPAVALSSQAAASTVPALEAPRIVATVVPVGEPMGWRATVPAGREPPSHGLEATRKATTPTRPVLIAGLLALVGASVFGTMAFFSDQRADTRGHANGAPEDGEREGLSSESSERRADLPVGEVPVIDLPVPEELSASSSGGAGGPGELGSEGDSVADEPAVEISKPLAPKEGELPRVREYEKAKCVETRDRSNAAFGRRQWGELSELARQKKCWPAKEQDARRRMFTRALLELGRFEECIEAGGATTDAEVARLVGICRKKVAK